MIRLTEFLAVFYPDEDEPIRFRWFKPKGQPDQVDNRVCEFTITRHALAADSKIQNLVKKCNLTRGGYFVVNAGISENKRLDIGVFAKKGKNANGKRWTQYIEDSDITRFNSFFAEMDDLPIDEQRARYESCPLPPSIMIATRKSMHGYWPITGDCTEDQWREVQARLIAYFNSDPQIKNPSRVMRLPGLDHLHYNEATQAIERKRVELVQFAPEQRYTMQEMLEAFPHIESHNQRQAKSNGRKKPGANGQVFDTWDDLNAELRWRIMSDPTAKQNSEGIYHCRARCHDAKSDSAIMFNPATGATLCLNKCSYKSLLKSFDLPERPASNNNASQNGSYTVDDALASLRKLDEGAAMPDIEKALRCFAADVILLDPIARGVARESAIRILKECGCSSPARLVDSAIPKTEEKREEAKGIALRDPDLWPEPVDGAALLDEIATVIRRYISASDHVFSAVALWILYAHAFDGFDVSPLLAITSPEKRCGKTTLLNLLSALVPLPLSMSNITASALFRVVEKYAPTLLIDEADSFLTNNEELRGILNSGHRKAGAYVIRATGDDYEPQQFTTWCPKAIALIGALPGTLEDRAIATRLQRKRTTEKKERLRFERLREFEPLRCRAARWAADMKEWLCAADPDIPPEITNDRARDNWRPLLAIADAAGNNWPQLARDTARVMTSEEPDSESAGTLLLGNLKAIFEDEIERLTSDEIILALIEMESRSWAEWKQGKPLSKVGLSRLLRPFGIKPQKWREGNKTLRGYLRNDFDDAFARYLVNDSPHSPHTKESTTCSESDSPQDDPYVATHNDDKPLETNDVASVATQTGGVEQERFEQVRRTPVEPIMWIDRCYNGDCGGNVTFTNGRGYCERCGVYQTSDD